MIVNLIVKVLTTIATWFVDMFPKGQPHLGVLESAFHYMDWIGIVVPVGTLVTVMGIGVGITAVVWIIQAIIWAWKLVKW